MASNSNFQPTVEPNQRNTPKTGGKIRTRHRQVAMLLASGLSVQEVERQTRMSASRIYHLLADQNSFVNKEIERIQNETLAANARLLPNLRLKTSNLLEKKMESPDSREQFRAANLILKIHNPRAVKTGGLEEKPPYTFDDYVKTMRKIVLENRKERGLTDDAVDPDKKDL